MKIYCEDGQGRDASVASLLQNDRRNAKWFKSFAVKAEMLQSLRSFRMTGEMQSGSKVLPLRQRCFTSFSMAHQKSLLLRQRFFTRKLP